MLTLLGGLGQVELGLMFVAQFSVSRHDAFKKFLRSSF